MTLRPPTLERPTEAEGPDPPEVLFKEARLPRSVTHTNPRSPHFPAQLGRQPLDLR